VFTTRKDHVKGKYNLGGLAFSDRIILKSVKITGYFVYSKGFVKEGKFLDILSNY
jgi:hypothetical protein